MKNLLQLSTSIMGENSVSRELASNLLAELAGSQEFNLIERNFADEPIPHLDSEWLTALTTPEADRSPDQRSKVTFSDKLIAELIAADILVIGLPMYNFSLPSMLKAWIDHIARAGVTFKYTSDGSVGLLEDKKVYLVVAMGGIHEASTTDFLRPYMKHVLAFVGLEDVEVITADGLNMGAERREQGLKNAKSQIRNRVSNVKERESL